MALHLPTSCRLRAFGLLCATGAVLLSAGCMQRRMTIRSNPPGALVYVDNQPIGTTPVSHDFIHYGTREIRLVKDGYETVSVLQPIRTPWYQWPGLDFFSEHMALSEIRDEQAFYYQLTPQRIVPVEEFLARGENLRTATNQPHAVPIQALPPPVTLPPPPPLVRPAPPPAVRQWPTPRVWPTPRGY